MWSLEELENNFNTSREKGLTANQVTESFKTAGENTLTERGKVPGYIVFLHEQTGFFSLLLWLGAALCFIAYGLGVYEEDIAQTGYLDKSNLYLGIVLATVVFITGVFSYL